MRPKDFTQSALKLEQWKIGKPLQSIGLN